MELTEREKEKLEKVVNKYVSGFDKVEDGLGDTALDFANDLLDLFEAGEVGRAPEVDDISETTGTHIVVMQDADSLKEQFGNSMGALTEVFNQVLEDRDFLVDQHVKMKEYINGMEDTETY